MQLLIELIPVILFFAAFKIYGIYAATLVGIASTFVFLILTRLLQGRWDKKQAITFLIFTLMGGLTFYFHDPIYVKWKPTIVYWIFAAALLFTQFFTSQPLMQRLMHKVLEENGHVPLVVWRRINVAWSLFFIILGVVNLYVAYHYTNDTWVNFKLFGVSGALLVFCLLQAIYLSRYITEDHK